MDILWYIFGGVIVLIMIFLKISNLKREAFVDGKMEGRDEAKKKYYGLPITYFEENIYAEKPFLYIMRRDSCVNKNLFYIYVCKLQEYRYFWPTDIQARQLLTLSEETDWNKVEAVDFIVQTFQIYRYFPEKFEKAKFEKVLIKENAA